MKKLILILTFCLSFPSLSIAVDDYWSNWTSTTYNPPELASCVSGDTGYKYAARLNGGVTTTSTYTRKEFYRRACPSGARAYRYYYDYNPVCENPVFETDGTGELVAICPPPPEEGCALRFAWVTDPVTNHSDCRNISGDLPICADDLTGPVVDDASCSLMPNPDHSNGIKDGDEIGVDCGGSNPAECVNLCNPAPAGCTSSIDTVHSPSGDYETCRTECPTTDSGLCPNGYTKSSPVTINSDGSLTNGTPSCIKSYPPTIGSSTLPLVTESKDYSFDSSNTPQTHTKTSTSTTDNPDGTKTETTTTVKTTTSPDGSLSKQITTEEVIKTSTGQVITKESIISGNTINDDIKEGFSTVKTSSDGVKVAVETGTATVGGKLDGLGGKLDGISSLLTDIKNKPDGSSTVTVNNVGVESRLDAIKGDGTALAPVQPDKPTFDPASLNATLSSRVQAGVSKIKQVYADSDLGTYVENGFGTLSGTSSPSMSVDMGSYGQKSVDFSRWADALGLLRLFLLAAAGVVCFRIVVLKQH